MSSKQAQEIRDRLDTDLSRENFERDYRSPEEAATQFFQDLFVQVLNFDETTSPLGDETWQTLPVHEWPNSAEAETARLFAKAGNFRVIYVELEKLTRTAERNAIQSLTRSDRTSGWAIPGSFLIVSHAPDEDIWHLVTPYEEETDDITTGRPILRRYTLGEGETHRTVASALADMDASKGRLAERINEAFRVKPVTEDFYENYKQAFDTLSDELRDDLEIEEADQYAHVTLNRLMFFYYLQKKGWIGDRKNFVRWFHEQYDQSDDSDQFHEKWLSSLFFDGMNQPAGDPVGVELPAEVEEAISEIAYMNGGLFQPTDLDENRTYLSDAVLNNVIRGFLEQYNFTVSEESPYDIDVAVDPAMLGKIYESLIAEQERGEAGIFYTPRVEVDLMCRMALYEQFCDHANSLNADGKQRIVEFVFTEPQDWHPEDAGETEALEEILHELRIVDPACGSGAFLVGMKQVLTELYRKLDLTPNYHLKEQIINENLYGVDIKDWAVRVAEFRLWLSLVEGEDELPDQRPVLPNFSFKLKVGDSLIQKLDDEFVSLDTLTRTLDGGTADLLTELKGLKRGHFEGEVDRTEEIEEKQVELLRRHINGLIDNLSAIGTQQTLTGETKNELDDDVSNRIEELEKVRDAIDDAGGTEFFMWDIDFSDVMVEGGFDVVIGNPPYVRQEDIIDQGVHPDRLNQMQSTEVNELKRQYKNDLGESVEETFDIKPYKRSDIYVYFYFKGLDLLRENGTLSFITSNSWMDIGYGKRLHEGFLRLTDLSYIIGNTSVKSFKDADVNTYITVANRSQNGLLTSDTCFVRLSSQFHQYDYDTDFDSFLTANSDSWNSIQLDGEPLTIQDTNDVRVVSVDHDSLWRLGGGDTQRVNSDSNDSVYAEGTRLVPDIASSDILSGSDIHVPSGSYSDGAWGRFVDAPTLYFELWGDYHDQFDLLGDLAEPTYGLKSGTNKFFFVPRPGQENTTFESEYDSNTGKLLLAHKGTGREFRIEPEFWMRPLDEIPLAYRDQFDCQHSINGTVYVPDLILVRNREISTSPIEPDHLNHVHITIDMSRSNINDYDAGEYVAFGEEPRWGRSNDLRLPDRSSLSGRSPEWYSQPSINDAYIILTNTFNAQLQFHYNPCQFTVSNRFYYLPSVENVRPGYLAGYMNSTFGWFMEEVTGRSWTNTLLFDKPEYLILPVLLGEDDIQSTTEDAVEDLLDEEVGTVFEEIGAYNPDDVSLDTINNARATLDSIFFNELDFTNEQQLRLYKTLVEMVRDRLMRQPDENPSLCETIAEHNPQYDYSR
jgi:hypothetical protein